MKNLYAKDQNRFYLRTLLGQVLIIAQPDGKDGLPTDSHNALTVKVKLLNNDTAISTPAAVITVQLPTFLTKSIKDQELNRLLAHTSNFFNVHDNFVNRHQYLMGPLLAALSNELEWDIVEVNFNLEYSKEEAEEVARKRDQNRFATGPFSPQPGGNSFRNNGEGAVDTLKPEHFNAQNTLMAGGLLVLS